MGTHRDGVPVVADGDGEAELVAVAERVGRARLAGIRRLEVRLLRPCRAAAREHIRSAGLRDGLVVLIAVDAGGLARVPERGYDDRVAVAADGDGVPELGAHRRIGGLQVCLLDPVGAVAHEDVSRAGAVHGVVVLVAVHAAGAAGFVRSADHHRVAVAADGGAEPGVPVEHAATPEVITRLGVRGLEVRELRDPHRWLPGGRLRVCLDYEPGNTEGHHDQRWTASACHDTSKCRAKGRTVLAAPCHRRCRSRSAAALAHRSSPCARSPSRCRSARCSRARSD